MTRRAGKSKREFATGWRWALCLTALLTFCNTHSIRAQQLLTDTVRLPSQAVPDSLSVPDTTRRQKISALEDSLGIRIAPDALPAPVQATARDSALLQVRTNEFRLFGNVEVQYEDLKLNAGQVHYDQKAGIISAKPATDTAAGQQPATFSQGSEKFSYEDLRYSFNTRKALVRNARTQYGEGYVFSEQIKRAPDQSIYGSQAVYTTCNLPHPHFGIRSRRIKVIPGRIAVAGSSNFEIEGVPTPLFLPFGLFPISEQQRSGFRIPSYTIERARGVGLTNGGYYIWFSDKADLLLTANIYSKGSFNVSAVSTYANRYRYSGMAQLAYGYDKQGEVFEPGSRIEKTFSVVWTHQTDPKSRPGLRFNAGINFQKGNYYQRNSYNPALVLQNQYRSSLGLTRTWTKRPMSLNAGAEFNQTFSGDRALNTLNLPSVNFYYSQITPFKRKNPVGSPKWYERITASYNFNLQNSLTFDDFDRPFSRVGFTDFRNGIRHSIPVSASYTALRYVNLSFGLNYNEYWLGRRDYINYNPSRNGLDTVTQTGFFAARDFSSSVSASTRIYGMKLFRTGRVAGIRHVLEPNISFAYVPDFAKKPFDQAYPQQLAANGPSVLTTPYALNAYVPTGPYGNFNSSLAFGINNVLQAKLRSRKSTDTADATRNINLIDRLSLNGSYNFGADSFKWNDFNLSFRTNLFEKVNINATALFDPYVFDYTSGRRINRILLAEGGGLVRLRQANVALSASLRSSSGTPPPALSDPESPAGRLMRLGASEYVDFNIPWNASVSYALTLSKNYLAARQKDTSILVQSVMLNGDFNLTPRWKIAVNTGFDVTNRQLTYTSLDIYRDLHCFEMRFNTIPFGLLKSFTFTLNVKASVLQDLRLQRRRDYRDSVF